MQEFASAPRAVGSRQKYRDADEDYYNNKNIMQDRRVVRGNTYASLVPQQQDPADLRKEREAQRKRLMRANQPKKRAGTPEPVAGRKHMDIQTDSFLEELTERTVAFEAETQTDFILDRPPSPLFMPAKTGVDIDTQIEDGDLFDFDVECESILDVLVGKTLEQSLTEVLEEEELDSLRRHQEDYEMRRNQEMLEVQRMEAGEKRRQDEMQRRMQQQAAQRESDLIMMRKVVSCSVASAHFSSLKSRALAHLLDAGVFSDSSELSVAQNFMPNLLEAVLGHVHSRCADTQLLNDTAHEAMAARVAKHNQVLHAEEHRLKVLDDAEREVRKEVKETKDKKEQEEKRILREQGRMKKWEAKKPPRPKVTDYVVDSFDGESALLADGRKVTEFENDQIKQEVQTILESLNAGIGETVVCNIATDPEFVPPDEADPNIMYGSKVISVSKKRTNSFTLDIIEAKGMREDPCETVQVVLKDVKGLVGPEQRTDVCEHTPTPTWNHKFKFPSTFNLAAIGFEVCDGHPEDKGEDSHEDPILRCDLPIDMLYDAYGKTPPDQEVELDAWLEARARQKEKEPGISRGKLHVCARAKFSIPILLPGVVIDLPSKFQIGLAWKFIHEDNPVDLDASVVGLNAREQIVDQVWFQKLKGFNGAVVHTGDDRSGEGDGDDEGMIFDMSLMPDSVQKLAVCINSYDEMHLEECVKSAYIRIIVDGTTHGFFSMSEGWIPKCTGLFFGAIRRTGDGWKFVTTAIPADGSTVERSLPAILAHGKAHLGW